MIGIIDNVCLPISRVILSPKSGMLFVGVDFRHLSEKSRGRLQRNKKNLPMIFCLNLMNRL